MLRRPAAMMASWGIVCARTPRSLQHCLGWPGAASRCRLDIAAGGALGVGALALYLKTAAPSLYTFDAPEFTIAAATWGIPHATGYPLFVLLGHLFLQALPCSEPAHRMTVMTALFAALTPATLFLVLRRLRLGRSVALLACGWFAVSYYQWNSAVVTKEHSLRDWLLAVGLYSVLAWRQSAAFGWLVGATAVFSLSLTNHMSAALYAPVLTGFVLARARLRLGRLAVLAAVVVVGLLPYAYLPLAYLAGPVFNIAGHYDRDGIFHPMDLTSWSGMWWILSARQFGPQILGLPIGRLPQASLQALAWLWGNFVGVGVVLGIFGAPFFWRRDRWFCGLAASLALVHAVFFVTYAVPDRDAMFVPVYLLWTLPLAFGLQYALVLAPRGWPRRVTQVAAALGVALTAWVNYPLLDISQDYRPLEWARAFLNDVPPGSRIVARWATAGPLSYLVLIEGMRPDVQVIDYFQIGPTTLAEMINTHVEDFPIVLDAVDLAPWNEVDPSIGVEPLAGQHDALRDATGSAVFPGVVLARNGAR